MAVIGPAKISEPRTGVRASSCTCMPWEVQAQRHPVMNLHRPQLPLRVLALEPLAVGVLDNRALIGAANEKRGLAEEPDGELGSSGTSPSSATTILSPCLVSTGGATNWLEP
jgi:hypothetical protein